MTTRVGDTTYGFYSTAGSLYSFNAGSLSQYCIWDAGGFDTLDCSGYSQNQVINLNAGTFSNVGGGTGNISIAVGATIESAVGGSGADSLIANAAGSMLDGGAGNDTLTCGAGLDIIVCRVGSGADTVIGFTAGADGDLIDLTAMPSIDDISDLVISQSGGGADTLIDFGNGDTLILQGVKSTDVSPANFAFVTGPGSGTGFVFIDDVTITEGDDGTSFATFTVTRSSSGTGAFTVNYTTVDGTATTADNDYVATSGTLAFAAGEFSKTISVEIDGDTKFEPDATFAVNCRMRPAAHSFLIGMAWAPSPTTILRPISWSPAPASRPISPWSKARPSIFPMWFRTSAMLLPSVIR
jgi:serralysin